jgi:hypothetical protein
LNKYGRELVAVFRFVTRYIATGYDMSRFDAK